MAVCFRSLLWLFLLLQVGYASVSLAQTSRIGSCAAFASNGDLLTGIVRDGDLQLDLRPAGKPLASFHEAVQNSLPCEISFSDDGKWAAVVIRSNELTVLVVDRSIGTIQSRFSSPWHGLPKAAKEPDYQGNFLGGFSANDSVVLWRYEPRPLTDQHDASQVDRHRQVWSIDGKLLIEQSWTYGMVGIANAYSAEPWPNSLALGIVQAELLSGIEPRRAIHA
jgi:hypothetical protein